MSNIDIASNLNNKVAMIATIATDTTTSGASIDTVNYSQGIMFVYALTARTDGTYTPNIQDSADNSSWADVDSAQLIGSETALSAATTSGALLKKIGAFGTRRYVRMQMVSTGTTSGATVFAVAVQGADNLPTT